MNESTCKGILHQLDSLGYKIDEIRHSIQYINDSHIPISRPLDEITSRLDEEKDRLLETKYILKKYMDEEGFVGEHSSMAVVGSFQTGFDTYIHNNDGGDRPHFHMRKNDTHVCIQFECPEYFRQGEEHEGGFLDDEEKDELVEFLKSTISIEKFKKAGITVWDMMCITWNWNNPDNALPEDIEIPDYITLLQDNH